VTIFSVLLALPIISVIFTSFNVNPIEAFSVIFEGAFGDWYGFSETLTKAIPLILCGVGLSVVFQTGFYNIGAEGQLLMGAIFSTWVALNFGEYPALILLPSMLLAGFIGGGIWGMIPTYLRVKYETNEVITTLMMNYIAIRILDYLVYGPWRGKEEWGFPYTSKFSLNAWLPTWGFTRIHYHTLIVGILAAVCIYIILSRTKIGFETRIVGQNPEAARYLGINSTKVLMTVMLVSGGLAGIAGFGEVAGVQHRLRQAISPGYGFTAIIVAWLGRLHPISTMLVAIIFGGLLVGGEMIQIRLGLPYATIQLFNGVFLLTILSGEFLLRNKIIIQWRDDT
jgi:simple sugar transport system permease protein